MLNIDELRQLTIQRRSIRGYDESREVSHEAIRAILECARWAPSGGNGQPWEFVVVRDKETRHKIADIYMKQLEPKREMDLAVRGTAKMTGDGFRHAPVHLIILGDPRVKESYPIRTKLEKADSHFITGLANATLLIHLAAASLGLASQYVSDANSPYMETMLKVMLGIPEPLRIYHLVPIGYAKGPVAAPPRRELEEFVHYEKYDVSKLRGEEGMSQFIMTRTLQGGYGRRRLEEEQKG
ncbi:MAG: nitroreductase family protein [Deltaproteobacteria bacterium]|nr:nitroreductase family protein [Deltaproteobacteria bacterium]MBI2534050.1 nitroreductase family protein [Deltaproteobacteria bacterium]MBI3066131.1 nitroreductase family protein [Deltaproteobacteria bacterium]